jgi:hypothetical protein
VTKDQKKFKEWCDKHPEITREQTADVFGCYRRTVYRYLSGETEPHGGVVRLLEVFTRFPEVESAFIKTYVK